MGAKPDTKTHSQGSSQWQLVKPIGAMQLFWFSRALLWTQVYTVSPLVTVGMGYRMHITFSDHAKDKIAENVL